MPGPALVAASPPDAGLFHRVYVAVAGRHPDLRPWHFQRLLGRPLYAALEPLLARVEGDVLDVGCGRKPYRRWAPGARSWTGIDVADGPEVDAVLVPGEPWPVDDDAFDWVVCTQVLEHVAGLDLTVSELVRCLRPGGQAIVSVPFVAGEHNSPHDHRRLTRHGLRGLLAPHLEVRSLHCQGAIGSTLGSLLLEWSYNALPRRGAGAVLTVLALPLWLGFCLAVNVAGGGVDRLDRTGLYYHNVVAHLRAPG